MTSCLLESQFAPILAPLLGREEMGDSAISVRDVVLQILHSAQDFVPSQAGSVMLSSPDGTGELVFVASFGTGSEQLVGQRLAPDTGIAGRVFRTGEPELTNTPSVQPTFYREIDTLTKNETSSLLVVPVKALGQTTGVLSLVNARRGHFSSKDLDLLTIFSSYLNHSLSLLIEAHRQRKKAMLDHLTGLYNDRFLNGYLQETLETALEGGHDVGLIFLDLDHFKDVVDAHGHLVGSQALREIGHLIAGIVKEFQGIGARYGGDEYVVVLPGGDRTTLLHLSEQLRSTIEAAELTCEGESHQQPITIKAIITASVGAISLHHLNSPSSEVTELRHLLIREADRAMYVAKALGKNRIHWATDPVDNLPALVPRR